MAETRDIVERAIEVADSPTDYTFIPEYRRTLRKTAAEITRLRTALEFYAAPETYDVLHDHGRQPGGTSIRVRFHAPIQDDEGKVARRALNGDTQEENDG